MFDVTVVAQRSLICQWISPALTPDDNILMFNNGRRELKTQHAIRDVEYLPSPRLLHFPDHHPRPDPATIPSSVVVPGERRNMKDNCTIA